MPSRTGTKPKRKKMVGNFHTGCDGLPAPPDENPSHLFVGCKCLEGRGMSPAGPSCRAEGDLDFGRNALGQDPRGFFDSFPR